MYLQAFAIANSTFPSKFALYLCQPLLGLSRGQVLVEGLQLLRIADPDAALLADGHGGIDLLVLDHGGGAEAHESGDFLHALQKIGLVHHRL